MTTNWTPATSHLYKINPFTKTYLLLFVILFTAFFGKLLILFLTTIFVFAVLFLSKIPLKMLWYNLKTYIILLIPFVFFLSILEYGFSNLVFIVAVTTYVRFLNVFVAGVIYALTLNPTDVVLLFSGYTHLRGLGTAIGIGSSVLIPFKERVKNVIALQQLRGIEFSWKIGKLKRTFQGVHAVAIPLIIQAVNLSQDYENAMVARGYTTNKKITLPPHLRLSKRDGLIICFGTLFLFFSLIY